MSQSGIPGVEQIGNFANNVGDSIGSLFSKASTPTPPPAPVAPPPAPSPSDATTSAAMSKAEQDEDTSTRRGQAANDLFGTTGGLSTTAPTARSVLLGS